MLVCPSCGKENPDGFAFCGYCRASLHEQPPAGLEERKIVSVLFCDLVGFTAASEQQDPEDVRARIRPYHARLREEIERYDGTVEKFVGDAVMAAFGAPVAHEDDAERAVRAGLRILETIRELNEANPDFDLQVRVGINTGEAVVAVGARPEHGEGIVTGDVVNTAARIESAAPVNGVAVSDQTYRATSRVFDYETLPPVSVKGKAAPLALWRAKAARSRFGSDVSDRFRTPFVGRELEKPLLIGIFERATQQESVQLVTVVGEPGVGKTRLIAELADYVDAQSGITRWRQGRCLPYGEGITFWALGEIVKAEAGILESDSAEVAADKLEAVVSRDEPERQWLFQRLAPLVGVEAASPAERQELFTAWRRFFEGLAAGRPSVLVFEDLHWADEALLDFLEHLAEWSQGVPLLVLCAARPELYERRPGWAAGQRNAHTINLSPLTNSETAELVAHLISTTVLSPELEQAVLERAGGNPLYAEEFVRLLADRGLDDGEAVLPESVQALIAARLDTLTPERKSLLQDAAVVGKLFWAGAVAEIGARGLDEVELALHELALKELVRPARTSSMEGESEYSFWHLLVRDVAYSQIPRAERARRHRAAARWIERKAGERVEDLAEVLAHHYIEALEMAEAAGDADQARQLATPARRFLALAGERALGLDAAQADSRLARALELTPADDPGRAVLLARWAEAAYGVGHLGEAAAALDEVLDSLRAGGRTEITARALQLRSRLSQRLGHGHHVALAAEAVDLLEHEAPGLALVDAYAQLASSHALTGAYDKSVAAADRACTLAETLGLPEPARALGYRGYARAYLGDEGGLDEMEKALSLLVEAGVGLEAAVLQNNLAIARYPLQGPARSLADFEAGIAFCEERGLVGVAAFIGANCPALLTELGRPDEATARAAALSAALEGTGNAQDPCEVRGSELSVRLARGGHPAPCEIEWLVETARTVRHPEVTGLALAVASAALAPEEPDHARLLLAELERVEGFRETPYYARQLPGVLRTALALDEVELMKRLVENLGTRYPLEEHALYAARAQLAERAGEHAEAAALYAEAAARWQEFGNVPERAYALLGRGRCLLALDEPGAQEPLREARELFASMGYQPALAETNALLGESAPAAAS
ncbi:MAG TPA: adenylate/guanylate cyclase domain-containing protein [Gaiellaceae bacterium]|nr:adenylate/guanylate cyclase domain-containing protein [Gaiellaceae bacterium]